MKEITAMEINGMLKERKTRYGDFHGHALIAQNLKHAMHNTKNWQTLPPDMKEALEMVAHKIGRVLNGDYSYLDSWVDMVGYLQLVCAGLQNVLGKRIKDELPDWVEPTNHQ